MRPTHAAFLLATLALATGALAQNEPTALVSNGTTLYRIPPAPGAVGVFTGYPIDIVAMVVVPPGVSVTGCVEGDVIAVQNAVAGRVYRVDNVRTGTPVLFQIGQLPSNASLTDLTFANGRLFGVDSNAVLREFSLTNFAVLGTPRTLVTGNLNIGGLVYDNVNAWFFTNNATSNLTRVLDPIETGTWGAVAQVNLVGGGNINLSVSDLDLFRDQVWLAARSGTQIRFGQLNTTNAALTVVRTVTGVAYSGSMGFAAFSTPCAAVDADPRPVVTCRAGASGTGEPTATFSVVPGGPGPFTFAWQIQTGPESWQNLTADWAALPCGGQARITAPGPSVTLTLRPCESVNTYAVRCTLTNECSSATSNAATMTLSCNNPANIAGQGQTPNCDGDLTPDDLTLFVNWFFAGNPRADIAGQGQTPGADGAFTADDLIYYVNLFFQGC
jgi:hypothetical protein